MTSAVSLFSKVSFTFALFTATANVVASGDSMGGKVVHIASVNDAILLKISGNTESSRPACATSGRFAVHKDSAHASVVLTAFATGKNLYNVKGMGTCNLWMNAEDLRWIEVCPITGC